MIPKFPSRLTATVSYENDAEVAKRRVEIRSISEIIAVSVDNELNKFRLQQTSKLFLTFLFQLKPLIADSSILETLKFPYLFPLAENRERSQGTSN